MIKIIDHINIVVRDLEKAKQFFLDMGFIADPSKEGKLEGVWIEQVTKLKNAKGYYCTLSLPNTQTNLELIQYDSPEDQDDPLISKPNHAGFRHVAFEVENIEEFISKMKTKGASFFSDIQEYKPTKKKLCYLYGPEDIILELAEYN